MNYALVKQLSSGRAIRFVTSVVEHSILEIPKVRYTLYVQFSHSSYRSALKTFTHIQKHSPSTSTNSSLRAEGRSKNQPSKSDSFHLALNKSIILLWLFSYLNFDIAYIGQKNKSEQHLLEDDSCSTNLNCQNKQFKAGDRYIQGH